jgi:hypothetical protein
MKRLLTCLFAVLVAATLLPSCKRIPLYDPQTDVYLKLDIRLNTDIKLSDGLDLEGNPALRDKIYGTIPESVRACFYDSETHKLVAEEFLPAEGGFVNIPAGTYDVTVYSLGTETTRVANTDTRASALAYTSDTGTRLRLTGTRSVEDYSVIYEPDHIFVGTREGVVIPIHADIDRTIVIEIEMPTLLDTYTFEARYVEGAGRIEKADVYITGQAPSRYMWDRRFPNRSGALYFQSEINVEKGHLFTAFNTFGKFPGAHNDVYLNVLVTDTNGGRYQWVYDVTDQFDNPDNTRHEIIIEDRIIIPEGDGGGFTHKVNDWDTEIIYVPL